MPLKRSWRPWRFNTCSLLLVDAVTFGFPFGFSGMKLRVGFGPQNAVDSGVSGKRGLHAFRNSIPCQIPGFDDAFRFVRRGCHALAAVSWPECHWNHGAAGARRVWSRQALALEPNSPARPLFASHLGEPCLS